MINYHAVMQINYPNASYTITGDSYESIQMDDKPSKAELDAAWDDVLLEMARNTKLDALKAHAEKAMDAIADKYSNKERESWRKQEAEARAWNADNAASTPFLDAYVAASGIAKADAVSAIIAKADAFEVASGGIIGQVVTKRNAIEAATTVAELEAVELNISNG